MSPKVPLSQETIAAAAKMWAEGAVVSQISESLGIPRNTICSLASRLRDAFPQRTTSPRVKAKIAQMVPAKPSRRTYIAGKWVEHATRVLPDGSSVTLPRVSFIDGAREDG